MHFAIDVREACTGRKTGKGQWVHGFTGELLTRGHEITLLTDSPPPDNWTRLAKDVQFFAKGWRWHLQAARWLKKQSEIDLFISTTSYLVPCLVGKSVPFASVVHDLIAFRGEPHDLKATILEQTTLARCLRRSQFVFTVSQSTKQDLLDRYDWLDVNKLAVVYAGPLRSVSNPNRSDGQTILCPATLCPRKNQLRLIKAFKKLKPELRLKYMLILLGASGWHDKDIIEAVETTPGVSWLNYVPDEKYEQLLQTCDVLALPSLYEGFGMQVLDALQRGIPVLTTDCGSLSEVAGDCAILVQPDSVEDIALGLNKILTDENIRAKLRECGPGQAANFSWKRTVDIFLLHCIHGQI